MPRSYSKNVVLNDLLEHTNKVVSLRIEKDILAFAHCLHYHPALGRPPFVVSLLLYTHVFLVCFVEIADLSHDLLDGINHHQHLCIDYEIVYVLDELSEPLVVGSDCRLGGEWHLFSRLITYQQWCSVFVFLIFSQGYSMNFLEANKRFVATLNDEVSDLLLIIIEFGIHYRHQVLVLERLESLVRLRHCG